jgi:hypothetical protein
VFTRILGTAKGIQALLGLGLTEKANLPIYYIWAQKAGDSKLIGGEWTILKGGSDARDAYFKQLEKFFNRPDSTDELRRGMIEHSRKTAAAIKPSLDALQRAFKSRIVADVREQVRREVIPRAEKGARAGGETGAAAATTAFLQKAAVVIGAVVLGYFALRKR